MGSSDWKNITNDPLGSGGGKTEGLDEPRERDSENWRMPTDDARNIHQRVAGAPEDLRMLPGDLQLKPQEVGAEDSSANTFEESIWNEDPLASSEGFDAFYWDTDSLRIGVLDP